MYHICIRVHNSVKRVYVHAHEHVHKVSVWPGHATFSRMHTHTRVSRYAVWPTLHNGNDSLFLCDITCLWHAVGRRTPVRDRGDGELRVRERTGIQMYSRTRAVHVRIVSGKKRTRCFTRSDQRRNLNIRRLLLGGRSCEN